MIRYKKWFLSILFDWGKISFLLFYIFSFLIILLWILKREWVTTEMLYAFFFLAGMYLGGRVTYWSMRYLRNH